MAIFDEKIEIRTVQRSALCGSRRELSNEYLLAKIGADTAENEPLKIWRKIQFIKFIRVALGLTWNARVLRSTPTYLEYFNATSAGAPTGDAKVRTRLNKIE